MRDEYDFRDGERGKYADGPRPAAQPKDLTEPECAEATRVEGCPDCKTGKFLEGPWGGSSVNVKCNNPECRHEFWIGLFGSRVVWGGRLDRDEPKLYRGLLRWR